MSRLPLEGGHSHCSTPLVQKPLELLQITQLHSGTPKKKNRWREEALVAIYDVVGQGVVGSAILFCAGRQGPGREETGASASPFPRLVGLAGCWLRGGTWGDPTPCSERGSSAGAPFGISSAASEPWRCVLLGSASTPGGPQRGLSVPPNLPPSPPQGPDTSLPSPSLWGPDTPMRIQHSV